MVPEMHKDAGAGAPPLEVLDAGGRRWGSICLFHNLQGLRGAARTENHRRKVVVGPVHESAGGRPGEGLVPKETTGVWPVAEHRLSGLGGKGSVCQAPTLASGWGEERESPGCLWELVCLQAWGEVPAGRVGVSQR